MNTKQLMSYINKIKRLVSKLEKTTVGNLTTRVDELESENSLLRQDLNAITNQLTLLRQEFETHSHTYSDKFIIDTGDGTGIETVETKTTG